MILIINTVGEDTKVILAKSNDNFKVEQIKGEKKQAEQLLRAIEKLAGHQLDNLKGLGVVNGAGRFTALRIGITVANTLAYALRVPVVDVKAGDFKNNKELVEKVLASLKDRKAGEVVVPQYNGEPNIG